MMESVELKDCNNTRQKKTEKDYWVLDQVLLKIVFIFAVFEILSKVFLFSKVCTVTGTCDSHFPTFALSVMCK